MTRSCALSRPGFSGRAEWLLDESSLLLTPEGLPLEVHALRDLTSVDGDGYEIRLGTLTLARLGAEGPTLLETLRRHWLVQRTDALRLTGSGTPHPFTGSLGGEAFHALLFDDLLLLAPDGQDVMPVFLPLLAGAIFDETAYVTHLTTWSGADLAFTRLAGQTEEFLQRVQAGRTALATASAAVLSARVPGLPGAGRATLAGLWPPGRLLSLPEMEAACSGFFAEFRTSWLAHLARRQEGEHLLDRGLRDTVFLGLSGVGAETAAGEAEEPDPAGPEPGPDPAGAVPGPTGAGEESAAAGPAATEPGGGIGAGSQDPHVLWLLAGEGDRWTLEALSSGDRATYRFQGGGEMPALVSSLLCAPQFSREALYLPLESLTGGRAELAMAARDLPFLRALRERFRGRVIHGDLARWKSGVDAPV
jgi:hypothetical protein